VGGFDQLLPTAEDIDSPLPEAAMIKAAATGNPLIIEHAELSKELRELEAAKRGQERSVLAAKSAYARLTSKIAAHETAIEGLGADAEQVRASETAAFMLTIGDRRFSERKAAGEALKAMLVSKATTPAGQSQKAGLQARLRGFRLEAYVRSGANGLSYTIEIERKRGYAKQESYLLSDEIDPAGLLRRFENCIKQVPAVLAAEEQELSKARADLPRLERQLTATGFARADRLNAVKARIADIEKALQPAAHGAAKNGESTAVQGDTPAHAARSSVSDVAGLEYSPPSQRAKIALLEAEFSETQARQNGRGRS
jgi:hypothetical protein